MQIDEADRILAAKTPYAVLEITEGFMLQPDAKDKLARLYRQLSLKVHPDRNPSENATKAFHKLHACYEHVLKKSSSAQAFKTKVNVEVPKPKPKSEPPPKPDINLDEIYCAAKTKNDTPCKKRADVTSRYCHVHRDYDPTKVKPPVVEKVKCRAKCKDDSPCSKSAADGSIYCTIHANYDPHKPKPIPKEKVPCAATTKAGQPCSKSAEADSAYCRVHRPAKL
ncbi:MAG: J domain-containing protein [Nitrosomonas sp.]|nr:J domain-containing protein [Nitrosomonas sp.]